jgi:hypothetical protein
MSIKNTPYIQLFFSHLTVKKGENMSENMANNKIKKARLLEIIIAANDARIYDPKCPKDTHILVVTRTIRILFDLNLIDASKAE